MALRMIGTLPGADREILAEADAGLNTTVNAGFGYRLSAVSLRLVVWGVNLMMTELNQYQ